MSTPVDSLERTVADLGGILRRLAPALRTIGAGGDFRLALERWLEALSSASGLRLRLESMPAGGVEASRLFERAGLTAPITTASGIEAALVLDPAPGDRPFGARDLRLLGAIADLTSAMHELTARIVGPRSTLEVLTGVFDQLPLGVVVYASERAPRVCNARARLLLQGAPLGDRESLFGWLVERTGAPPGSAAPSDQGLTLHGGSLHVELRRIGNPGVDPVTVVLLTDLRREQSEMLRHLEREVRLGRERDLSLALAIIETPNDPGAFFGRLPVVEEGMRAGGICGLFGDRRIGLILPDRSPVLALHAARGACRRIGEAGLRVGMASSAASATAEQLVRSAVEALAPADDLLGPRALVVDRYPVVAETVRLVARGLCEVEGATNLEEALERMGRRCFDVVVVEHEPDEGLSGDRLLGEARAVQPEIAGMFLTGQADLDGSRAEAPADTVFVGKPFSVPALRSALASLLSRTAPSGPPR